VARQLRIPEGTLSSRLTTARRLLAKRLTRHGLTCSGGSLAAVLAQGEASACVPASVLSATVQAAAPGAAGQAAVFSAEVSALTEGVLRAMLLSKLKTATVLLLAAVLAAALGTLIVPMTGATAADREKEKPAGRTEATRAEEPRAVQVRLAGPAGMKVYVRGLTGKFDKDAPVEVPGRLDLEQGKLTRLKLADIPNRPGSVRYPTIEIPLVDKATEPFVSTSAVPVEFTDADFDHAAAGTAIIKVVYLASPKKGQPSGEAVTIASYDCEGDVIAEAKRRGPILAVVRMGDIVLGEGGDNREQRPAVPAPQLEEGRRELAEQKDALAVARKRIEALQEQLRKAEVEVKSLQEALSKKEDELQKLRKAREAGEK
jgi:hypothetical protein